MANKFFQNFFFIADALNLFEESCDGQVHLWNEEDGFFYDVLKLSGGGQADEYISVRLRSLVGLITLAPVLSIDLEQIDAETAIQAGIFTVPGAKATPLKYAKMARQYLREAIGF